MLRNKQFLILLIPIFLISCNHQVNKESGINNLDGLLTQLPNPPVDYRTAPLWDWNEKINEEDIAFQLQKFKEGGLGGVFVHPRPGLVTDYLSDDWNKLYKYTVEKGKELGMKVWIYDENSYPSGFAGGHVQDRFPDSFQNGSGLGLLKISSLSDTSGLNLRVEAILQKENDTQYYVFHRTFGAESWWYGGFPYVDLLYPGVTDTFIQATMEGYERSFGEEFGKTVPGVFTDEPNLPAAKGPGTLIRWTPDLFEVFKERWGYSLQDKLISLTEEYGEWRKVRHNYHELMLELFLDRWAVPWNKYCEENGLIWTGHYWEHGWPIPGEGYDEAAFYMYHQMPGVDMLGRVLCEDGMCQQFGNIRAVRELASAANQSGATRRFSETYGGGGWQVSFTDLKRLLDWECVLGVNFVNQHLSYFSMQGVRKFDYPPSFSYQEPWWDQHKLLGDYTARISMALSAGEQINKVLVLQPNTTAWMYHADGDRHGEEIHGLSVGFKEFIMQLEADQLEYDLGSEQVLKRFGSVGNNGLQVGERSYSKIIIPPGMQNLDSNTLRLLEELSGSGLELLVLSDSIDYLDGEFQKDILAKVSYSQAADLKDWFEQEDLDLSTIKGNQQVVFHQRRVLDNGELLFLVNSSASESAHLQLSWKGKNLYEVNLITGELHSINHTKNGKHIECDLFLHPVGSKLLISSDKSLENQVLKDLSSSFEGGVTIPSSSPLLASRLSDNVLTIDYLDVETKDFKISDSYFMNAMYKLFEWSELPTGNPWQHKIQFKQTYMDMDSFDTDTWHKITYMFDIAGDLSPDQLRSLKLVAERPEIWTVSINGHSVDAMADKWWLDRHFPVYSIGEFVQKGINSIELSADKMSVFAEIMPVYILGDFALKNAAKGFAIVAPEQFGTGAWNEKGLQFYSNKVAYKQSFMLDDKLKDGERCFLKTNDWQAVVTELLVNDEFVVSIAWQDQVDITDFLKAGKNTIELRLTGSLKNTLGFHHKDLTGWIDGPFSWNQAPANQPPGSDYRFMEYGIVGGIQLFIVEVE
ncbi:MAG: hypothetical protein HOK84_14290 [Bacteroidetes bacterium]|nr:hypothetical protein [Bacteroidota bacterium]